MAVMTTDFEHDTPGVIAPPPLMAVAVIVLGLLLDWIAPAYILANVLSLTVRIVLGLALIAASGFLHFSSVGLFRRAGTNPEPWKPTLHLITGGIYRWLRNPIYVAGVLGIAGIAIIFDGARYPVCIRSSFRRRPPRGALPRSEIRRRVPPLQVERAALRLAVLLTPSGQSFRQTSICGARPNLL
jgi:hypothetical protein